MHGCNLTLINWLVSNFHVSRPSPTQHVRFFRTFTLHLVYANPSLLYLNSFRFKVRLKWFQLSFFRLRPLCNLVPQCDHKNCTQRHCYQYSLRGTILTILTRNLLECTVDFFSVLNSCACFFLWTRSMKRFLYIWW